MASKIVEVYPGYNRDFFGVQGLSAAEMLRGRRAAGEAKSFPTGEKDLAPFFYRKFINCLLKHCEIWKKGQFKPQKLL